MSLFPGSVADRNGLLPQVFPAIHVSSCYPYEIPSEPRHEQL